MQNVPLHTGGSGTANTASDPQKPSLGARAAEEGKKFLIMTLYLWVLFAVLNLHKTAILRQDHIDYVAQSFAIVNALIFSKVMLTADAFKLGARFDEGPLIYSVLYASSLFAVVLVCFHVFEEGAVALLRGEPVVKASLSGLGAGDLRGVLSYVAIAFVTLIPFFLFRGIARALGEDQIWKLVFARRVHASGVE